MEGNIITSPQNARVKHVVALQQKSSLRREEGLFVVEGRRETDHCIACGYEVVEIWRKVEREKGKENTSAAEQFPLHPSPSTLHHYVTPQVYEKMAYRDSTEGIIAVVKCKAHTLSALHLQPSTLTPLLIVLESVEKPGNL